MVNVLMVDDSKSIGYVAGKWLKEYGVNCFSINHPTELFDKGMPSQRLIEIDPDVILLDIVMPDISGLEVLTRLKSFDRYKETPIIMLSSASSRENVLTAIKSGAVGFITKPFNETKLCSELAKRTKFTQGHELARVLGMYLNGEPPPGWDQSLRLGICDLNLMNDGVCHNKERLLNLVRFYMEGFPGLRNAMELSFEGGNIGALMRWAQALRPIFALFQAPLLVESAEKIYTLSNQKQLKAAAQIYSQLEADLDVLAKKLHDWLENSGTK